MRADTTVVDGNVGYPTDSGLLTKAIRKIAAAVAVITAAGLASRTTVAAVHDRGAGKLLAPTIAGP